MFSMEDEMARDYAKSHPFTPISIAEILKMKRRENMNERQMTATEKNESMLTPLGYFEEYLEERILHIEAEIKENDMLGKILHARYCELQEAKRRMFASPSTRLV